MSGRSVLVTRPAADAEPFARRIETLGHRALIEPLLDIRFLDDAAPDLSGVAALAFTSANGVRALIHADASANRLPAFCVGRATARVAEDAGFRKIHIAGGDVAALAQEIITAHPSGAVLHIAGRERAGDLVKLLSDAAIDARRAVLYAAAARKALSAETRAALAAGHIDDVIIFSPRTARQFVTLLKEAGLEAAANNLRLLALSARVAEAADIAFAEVAIAAHPDQDAILDLLGRATA